MHPSKTTFRMILSPDKKEVQWESRCRRRKRTELDTEDLGDTLLLYVNPIRATNQPVECPYTFLAYLHLGSRTKQSLNWSSAMTQWSRDKGLEMHENEKYKAALKQWRWIKPGAGSYRTRKDGSKSLRHHGENGLGYSVYRLEGSSKDINLTKKADELLASMGFGKSGQKLDEQ